MMLQQLLRQSHNFGSWVLNLLAPFALAGVALLSLSCSAEAPPHSPSKLKVVTTNGVLADLAKEVGAYRLEVVSLVPPGADLHSFHPTPANMKTISDADVIVYNGLGLDDALLAVIRNNISPATLVVMASEGLQFKPIGIATQGESDSKSNKAATKYNPHLWLNPIYAIHYTQRIADGLSLANPKESAQYRTSAEAYIERLRRLDVEVAAALNVVPPERRLLVTFHDAFGYFADRYGWGSSSLLAHEAGDITPQTMAHIIDIVTTKGITAIFTGPQFNSGILDQLSKDTRIAIGIIYSDTLDDSTSTYIDMMRFNANSIATHLGDPRSDDQ